MSESSGELKEVYRAKGEVEAAVIRGLLEVNGIPSIIRSNAAPSIHAFTVDGMGEFRVMVRQELEGRAKELIESKERQENP